MRRPLYLIFTVLVISGYAEDVALKEGAKVQAPMLKDADDAIVLDLDHDVLRIPRKEVLAIYANRWLRAPTSLYSGEALPLISTAAAAGKIFKGEI